MPKRVARDGSISGPPTPRHAEPGRAYRNTARWKAASAAQIRRQPWCSTCGTRGDRSNPLTCDHRIPVAAGGAVWDSRNHDTLCRRCNSAKGGRGSREDGAPGATPEVAP